MGEFLIDLLIPSIVVIVGICFLVMAFGPKKDPEEAENENQMQM